MRLISALRDCKQEAQLYVKELQLSTGGPFLGLKYQGAEGEKKN